MSDSGGDILKISGLEVIFASASGPLRAIHGVDIAVKKNEVFGIAGESGSGKTVTALSVLKLLGGNGKISAGRISFDGTDITSASERDMRAIRGARISMVFQEPAAALDPVFTAGYQVVEAALAHGRIASSAAKEAVMESFKALRIKDPGRVYSSYPHQLSGGVRQRVCMAAALINSPELVIMDEPTTALDVTVQAEILDLISEIAAERKISVLFISHDLGLIAKVCQRAAIMCKGRIAETGDVSKIFKDPSDDYTRSLIKSARALA
jgi:ABC-type dipeptide/oligopeptide/nickel transport system ATPase component